MDTPEQINEWAADNLRALLVRVLLNIAREFEAAAQERAGR